MTDKLREAERDAFERALASKPDARFWNTTDAMFWAWQARAALAKQDAQAVPQGGKLVPVEPTVWNSRKPGTGMPSGVQADDTVEWVNLTGISAISPHAQLLAWDGDYPVVRWRLVEREAPQPAMLNVAPTPPAQPELQRLTRDDTEHGVEYYRASVVDRVLAMGQDAQAVPHGYKLVPVEPTQKMVDEIQAVIDLRYNPANKEQKYQARHTYSAMLAAAPTPPAQEKQS